MLPAGVNQTFEIYRVDTASLHCDSLTLTAKQSLQATAGKLSHYLLKKGLALLK
jgi:hypothetical protein